MEIHETAVHAEHNNVSLFYRPLQKIFYTNNKPALPLLEAARCLTETAGQTTCISLSGTAAP